MNLVFVITIREKITFNLYYFGTTQNIFTLICFLFWGQNSVFNQFWIVLLVMICPSRNLGIVFRKHFKPLRPELCINCS